MISVLKESLWKQFGASIDMLENALVLCPESIWDTGAKFWYIAFDVLFYLDYYLTLQPENFSLPAPFAFAGPDPNDGPPERVYTKNELLTYLQASRTKCRNLIETMTDEIAGSEWTNVSKTMHFSVIEIVLYNMRHVQHHTGQLNLLLRQGTNDAPGWVDRTKTDL
jgi:hypothetical protein